MHNKNALQFFFLFMINQWKSAERFLHIWVVSLTFFSELELFLIILWFSDQAAAGETRVWQSCAKWSFGPFPTAPPVYEKDKTLESRVDYEQKSKFSGHIRASFRSLSQLYRREDGRGLLNCCLSSCLNQVSGGLREISLCGELM